MRDDEKKTGSKSQSVGEVVVFVVVVASTAMIETVAKTISIGSVFCIVRSDVAPKKKMKRNAESMKSSRTIIVRCFSSHDRRQKLKATCTHENINCKVYTDIRCYR